MGALLLAGCEQATDPDFFDRQFIPVGHWEFNDGGYEIDNATVRYYTPDYGEGYPASELKGNIVTAVDFSENSGVLIIKVTELEEIGNTVGKYTGVYYKDYTSSHINMANAIDSETYAPIEVDTLNQALVTFTAGKMGVHVTYWGSGYSK
jgi:hypothetical protein